MRVIYDAEAVDDLRAAVAYYDGKRSGLGDEFESEVRKAIDLVLQFPNGWPLVEAEARRIRVNRFPYGVVYLAGVDELYIAAIMNLHREPGWWTRRLDR
jgi:hypothetical protein